MARGVVGWRVLLLLVTALVLQPLLGGWNAVMEEDCVATARDRLLFYTISCSTRVATGAIPSAQFKPANVTPLSVDANDVRHGTFMRDAKPGTLVMYRNLASSVRDPATTTPHWIVHLIAIAASPSSDLSPLTEVLLTETMKITALLLLLCTVRSKSHRFYLLLLVACALATSAGATTNGGNHELRSPKKECADALPQETTPLQEPPILPTTQDHSTQTDRDRDQTASRFSLVFHGTHGVHDRPPHFRRRNVLLPTPTGASAADLHAMSRMRRYIYLEPRRENDAGPQASFVRAGQPRERSPHAPRPLHPQHHTHARRGNEPVPGSSIHQASSTSATATAITANNVAVTINACDSNSVHVQLTR